MPAITRRPDRPSTRPAAAGRWLSFVPLLWILAALVVSGVSLRVMFRTEATAAALGRLEPHAAGIASTSGLAPVMAEVASGGRSAQADLANGLYLAHAAAAMSDSGPDSGLDSGPASVQRRAVLDTAILAIMRARPRRLYWGEASAILAYARSQRDGIAAPATLASYAQSYRETPYLPNSGPWRIDYGFANWDRLAPDTRTALVNEAVWYARKGPGQRHAVFDRVRASSVGAYVVFMKVWLASRVGDADFVPLDGETP